ncbi:hypothetical protein TNCV_2759281 [Trichonephila clavipes]|nr:hypothetical protein TNCV_2759281 [Trichonephila clavipes]
MRGVRYATVFTNVWLLRHKISHSLTHSSKTSPTMTVEWSWSRICGLSCQITDSRPDMPLEVCRAEELTLVKYEEVQNPEFSMLWKFEEWGVNSGFLNEVQNLGWTATSPRAAVVLREYTVRK